MLLTQVMLLNMIVMAVFGADVESIIKTMFCTANNSEIAFLQQEITPNVDRSSLDFYWLTNGHFCT